MMYVIIHISPISTCPVNLCEQNRLQNRWYKGLQSGFGSHKAGFWLNPDFGSTYIWSVVLDSLIRRAAATPTHYTRMACESSKTFDDLTRVYAQKDSARVTSNLLEGLKMLPVESNHRVFLVSHPGKIQYYVCSQCKGIFFTPRDFTWVKDIP